MSLLERAQEPQYVRALARANHIRLARAALKHRVRAGEITAAAVVLDPPEEALTMLVSELLCSQVRWGGVRARKLLRSVPLLENKTIGTLTERQRDVLANALTYGVPVEGYRDA